MKFINGLLYRLSLGFGSGAQNCNSWSSINDVTASLWEGCQCICDNITKNFELKTVTMEEGKINCETFTENPLTYNHLSWTNVTKLVLKSFILIFGWKKWFQIPSGKKQREGFILKLLRNFWKSHWNYVKYKDDI